MGSLLFLAGEFILTAILFSNANALNDPKVPELPIVPIGKSQSFCTAKPDGLYPDPSSCSFYIQCDDGTKTRLKCSESTWFSPAKKVCVSSKVATCKESKYVTEGTEFQSVDSKEEQVSSDTELENQEKDSLEGEYDNSEDIEIVRKFEIKKRKKIRGNGSKQRRHKAGMKAFHGEKKALHSALVKHEPIHGEKKALHSALVKHEPIHGDKLKTNTPALFKHHEHPSPQIVAIKPTPGAVQANMSFQENTTTKSPCCTTEATTSGLASSTLPQNPSTQTTENETHAVTATVESQMEQTQASPNISGRSFHIARESHVTDATENYATSLQDSFSDQTEAKTTAFEIITLSPTPILITGPMVSETGGASEQLPTEKTTQAGTTPGSTESDRRMELNTEPTTNSATTGQMEFNPETTTDYVTISQNPSTTFEIQDPEIGRGDSYHLNTTMETAHGRLDPIHNKEKHAMHKTNVGRTFSKLHEIVEEAHHQRKHDQDKQQDQPNSDSKNEINHQTLDEVTPEENDGSNLKYVRPQNNHNSENANNHNTQENQHGKIHRHIEISPVDTVEQVPNTSDEDRHPKHNENSSIEKVAKKNPEEDIHSSKQVKHMDIHTAHGNKEHGSYTPDFHLLHKTRAKANEHHHNEDESFSGEGRILRTHPVRVDQIEKGNGRSHFTSAQKMEIWNLFKKWSDLRESDKETHKKSLPISHDEYPLDSGEMQAKHHHNGGRINIGEKHRKIGHGNHWEESKNSIPCYGRLTHCTSKSSQDGDQDLDYRIGLITESHTDKKHRKLDENQDRNDVKDSAPDTDEPLKEKYPNQQDRVPDEGINDNIQEEEDKNADQFTDVLKHSKNPAAETKATMPDQSEANPTLKDNDSNIQEPPEEGNLEEINTDEKGGVEKKVEISNERENVDMPKETKVDTDVSQQNEQDQSSQSSANTENQQERDVNEANQENATENENNKESTERDNTQGAKNRRKFKIKIKMRTRTSTKAGSSSNIKSAAKFKKTGFINQHKKVSGMRLKNTQGALVGQKRVMVAKKSSASSIIPKTARKGKNVKVVKIKSG